MAAYSSRNAFSVHPIPLDHEAAAVHNLAVNKNKKIRYQVCSDFVRTPSLSIIVRDRRPG